MRTVAKWSVVVLVAVAAGLGLAILMPLETDDEPQEVPTLIQTSVIPRGSDGTSTASSP